LCIFFFFISRYEGTVDGFEDKLALKGCVPAKKVTGNCYPLQDANGNILDNTVSICPQECSAMNNPNTYGKSDYCQTASDCLPAEPNYFFSNQCETDPKGCCADGHSLVSKGCPGPTHTACEKTEHGCCADGVTARTYKQTKEGIMVTSCNTEGWDGKTPELPSYPANCSNFLYGCCTSDGKTPSNTEIQSDKKNTCPKKSPYYPTVPPYDPYAKNNIIFPVFPSINTKLPTIPNIFKKREPRKGFSKEKRERSSNQFWDWVFQKKGPKPYYDPIVF